MQGEENLNQFFFNLNAIEEYFEKPEHLSYEGIEEKLDLLKVINCFFI